MPTAVLFDIDGTLVDHTSAEHAGVQALLAVCGQTERVPAEVVAEWRSSSARHFGRYLRGERTFDEQRRDRIREVIDGRLADSEADQLFTAFAKSYEASWMLFADVMPCLTSLRGYKLGIVSNGDGEQQRRKLHGTSIASFFEVVVVSGNVGFAKPDRRIFEHACKSLGERPQNVVYIGDVLQSDAIAAVDAGLRGIWLNRTGLGSDDAYVRSVGSLDELPRLVSSLEG